MLNKLNEEQLIISTETKTNWKIVVAEDAIPAEKHAASELQHFLQEICSIELPIVYDNGEITGHEIAIGDNRHLHEMDTDIDFTELKSEGFIIRTIGENLIIAGGKPRGTLYGVYSFLEEYLGCRWFSSKVSYIPKRNKIELGRIDVKKIPVLDTRTALYNDAFDGDWAARNKINCWGTFQLEEKHGGKVKLSRHFVHTFYDLVPPDKYFNEHPEYFSLVNGERLRSGAQLCLTHPEVFKIALKQLKQWIEEEPDVTIFGVSQNDCTGACECENCKAIDKYEGSHSGTILTFVNKLAEAIEGEHPDKKIETLAYWYTRKPPEHIKPHKNVIIRLCSIECCFMHPLDECEKNHSFVDDVTGWGKISDQVYIWDYTVDFLHYLMPFPNLRVLKPNIRFFVKNSTLGIMAQGSHTGLNTEFAELKAYLLAKLLWDPEQDCDILIDEFLTGYYSMASVPIKQYIKLLEKQVDSMGDCHMGCFAPVDEKFFTQELLDKADELFSAALQLADNEDILKRVRIAHMQIKYVRMMQNEQDTEVREAFFNEAIKLGITRITEWKPIEESWKLMEEKKPF